MEFYSARSYPRRVGVGITRQGGNTPTSMRNRRCKNVSTIPGRISDTPKKNTLATTYAIIVERFTIKLKMIEYIVLIVDDTSKDQHALISTRRRRHWEAQRAPPITNVRTADKREQTSGRSYLWKRLLPCLLVMFQN